MSINEWNMYACVLYCLKQSLTKCIFNLKIIRVYFLQCENVKYFENFEPNFHLFVKFIFFVNDYFMKGTLYSIGVFWKNFSFFWTGSRLVLEILDVKSH